MSQHPRRHRDNHDRREQKETAMSETHPEPPPAPPPVPPPAPPLVIDNPPYVPPPGPTDTPPPVPPEPTPDPAVQAYLEGFQKPADPRDPTESELRHQDLFPPSDVAAAGGEAEPSK